MSLDIAEAIALRAAHHSATFRVGKVVSGSGESVVVDLDGVQVTVTKLAAYSPVTAGDVVLVAGAAFLLGKLGAGDPPPTPEPQPPVTGSSVFLPTYTGSYRGGWRTDRDQPIQGDWTGHGVNHGAAFYSGAPRGLAGAVVTAVSVVVHRKEGGVFGAQTPTMRLWAEQDRPAGAPTSAASTPGPSLAVGQSSEFVLPVFWGQALVDGTAGGLGIYVGSASPYVVTAGRSGAADAWALRINWSK